MTPTIPAAAKGVRNPSANSKPALISVSAAIQACNLPGFIPMLSNQPAVPGMRPPWKILPYPWAAKVSPTPTRSISIARFISSISPQYWYA